MDLTYVVDYCDESVEEDNGEEDCEPRRKRRRVTRLWLEKQTFQTAEEAESVVKAGNNWKISSTKETTSGHRVNYRCILGQYRLLECPAGLYLLYRSESEAVSLFETEDAHANHIDDPARGLPSKVKSFVRQKFADGITKPNHLLDRIRREKLPVPKKVQLVSFLQALRLKKFGAATVSAADLVSWCEERTDLPSDVDEVFVVDFQVRADSYDVNEQQVRVVLSTRRLLSFCKESRMVQCDATYKLLWNGFPVLIAGTTDCSRVFHPFVLSVTTGETAQDFEFIFRAIRKFHTDWTPTVLLADGADAITKGFTSVFGEPLVRLMCYFHVTENAEKYLKPLRDSTANQLKEDIRTL